MKETAGSFHVVGVGPGDPELMTIKAMNLLNEADVIVAPRGSRNGSSVALNIVKGAVDLSGKELLSIYFPMVKIDVSGKNGTALSAWRKAADIVANRVRKGRQVVFPTLGDPAFYSTSFYVMALLSSMNLPDAEISFIPGVSSIGACSACAGIPAVLAGETMAVVPAAFSDVRIEQALDTFDSVILMKVHRSMERIVKILEKMSLLEYAVLVERTTMAEERVWKDLRSAPLHGLHYFSTIIVRKRGLPHP